jgi:phosphatidate cytidylyltransferase
MLKQRVITALIAAPTVIAAIFFLPLTAFALVFLVLAGLGVFEWANLAGIRSVAAKAAYLLAYAVLGYLLLNAPSSWPVVLKCVVAFWVFAAVVVLTFPASGQVLIGPVLIPTGYVAFVGAWLALVALLVAGGPWLILWVLIVVWAADIGAYFAGRRFGRRKLALLVSPGKTWEGAIGGTLLSVLLGAAMGMTVPALQSVSTEPWQWIVGSLVIAIVSVFGDLFESALKRARGVKDSGGLFPGHGGMLDRVDSLIAALPCVALAVTGQG